MQTIGFRVYLLFVLSWFLHLTERIPVLSYVRFDMALVGILAVVGFLYSKHSDRPPQTDIGKSLKMLIAFMVLATPFAEWPGSAIKFGIPGFLKAVVFYYFTHLFVKTEKELKLFMGVLLFASLFRVLEPLYLHLTEGYWGSMASMANEEFMNRLSGSPHDVVNPNGLAFIIVTIIPFAYYYSAFSARWAVPMLASLPLCLYALQLTGSRSGVLGLIVIMGSILLKSRHKVLLLAAFVVIIVIGFISLPPDLQDRYLSIVDGSTKNAATTEGRITGIVEDFQVAFRRPLFGHGLGTSREANANYGGSDQPAHNLYVEVMQELGLPAVLIFIWFIICVLKGFRRAMSTLKECRTEKGFLVSSVNAMQVWLAMNIIFSFASYGLSKHEWYLFAALSAVISRLALETSQAGELRVPLSR